jgi:hypothetical protein
MQLKCLEVEARGGGKLDLKNNELLLWRREHGVFYELRRGPHRNLLSLETSLPKLLWGHNRNPVSPEKLPDAFEELTRRGRSFIPSLPPADELDAWRVDATADTLLGSELELALVGRVLADFSLNGTMPVRHPSGGSLAWPANKSRRLPGARCYGKFAESGDAKAVGQYRAEVQHMGGGQWHKALAVAVAAGDLSSEWASGTGKRCIRAGTLASDKSLCTGLLGALNGILDTAIGLVRDGDNMTALEAIELLEQKADVKRARAVQLVGYSHIIRVLGWSFTGLDPSNIWRAKKSFAEAGVDPALIEFSSVEKLGAGAGMVAAGAIAGAALVAGAVAVEAVGRAVFPDPPQSVPAVSVEPSPVTGGEVKEEQSSTLAPADASAGASAVVARRWVRSQ